MRDPLTRGFYKENADDLRSAHGDRGVRLRIAHAKAAKALLRSLSAGSLSFAALRIKWLRARNETLLSKLIRG